MNKPDDIVLIAKIVADGDKKAFDILVKRHQSPLRRFFLNQTCGDKELSNDLAQDTFIKIYTNLGSFKNLSSFSTWLYRIAYNVYYDYIRKKKETSEINTETEIPVTYSKSMEQHLDIYQSLKILSTDERTCITLFYMEDLSIEKISTLTKWPSGTIKSHLSRGKQKLATYLKQNGYDGN